MVMFGQRVVVVVLVYGGESVCRLLSFNAARAECGWMQNVGFGGGVKIMLGLGVGMVELKLGTLEKCCRFYGLGNVMFVCLLLRLGVDGA